MKGNPVSVGHEEIILGALLLRYELRRSSRRTVGITVGRDGAVVVTAPHRASLKHIHASIQKHGDWIWKQIRKFEALPPPPRPPRWTSGDVHRFLGREYALEVHAARGRGVSLDRGRMLVLLPDPGNPEQVRLALEKWYRDEAAEHFRRRTEELVRGIPALGLARSPEIRVRRLKRRWGSCSPRGVILMNTHAIKLDPDLIDYILVHELCHLRMPHHRPSFWRFLERCLPDWKERKLRLDQADL